jgi:ABC-type tungstate transport system substrate-binding protein
MAEQGCVAPSQAQEYFMLAVAEALLVKQTHQLFRALVVVAEAVLVGHTQTPTQRSIGVLLERQIQVAAVAVGLQVLVVLQYWVAAQAALA